MVLCVFAQKFHLQHFWHLYGSFSDQRGCLFLAPRPLFLLKIHFLYRLTDGLFFLLGTVLAWWIFPKPFRAQHYKWMEIANHILMTVEKGGKKEKGRECGRVENIHFRFSFHEVGDLVTVWTIFFVLFILV